MTFAEPLSCNRPWKQPIRLSRQLSKVAPSIGARAMASRVPFDLDGLELQQRGDKDQRQKDHSELRCCTDPAGGARGRAGVAGRLPCCPRDAHLALQADPGPPPPHPGAEA